MLAKVFANFSREAAFAHEVHEIITLARAAALTGTADPTTPEGLVGRVQFSLPPLERGTSQFSLLSDADRDALERFVLKPLPPPAILPHGVGSKSFPQSPADAVRRLAGSLTADGHVIPGLRPAVTAGQPGLVGSTAAELELAERFAALFGRRIVVVESDTPVPPFNGVTNRGIADTIFVHARATRPVWAVAGHEMWHHLENAHPDLAAQLVRALEPGMIRRAALAAQKPQYAAAQLTSELMGDLLADSLGSRRFWDALLQREPSLFVRLAHVVMDWLRDVADALRRRGTDSAQFFRDVDAARGMLADALAEFTRRENGQPARPLPGGHDAGPLPQGPVNQFSHGGTHIRHQPGTPYRVNERAWRSILTGSALPAVFHETVQATERERKALDQACAQIGNDLKAAAESHAKRHDRKTDEHLPARPHPRCRRQLQHLRRNRSQTRRANCALRLTPVRLFDQSFFTVRSIQS